MTTVVLSADATRLVDVARKVLTGDNLPDAALVGGLAVTIRVAAPATLYRATADVDVVTNDEEPTFVEIITTRHDAGEPLIIDGIKVDVIATSPVSDADLAGIEDGPRLFAASHRWALETAEAVTLTTDAESARPFRLRVATPAALVAAKAHALGFARSQRRTTKHGSDLLDVYRLVELYDSDGSLSAEVRGAPAGLARIIAAIAERELMANPAAAAHRMSLASLAPIDAGRVADTMEAFVEVLRS